MSLIDMQAVVATAKKDPEFVRETRYLNGSVKLVVADEEHILSFVDGKLISADQQAKPDSECKIFVKGTRDHWLALMKTLPKPFYQCLQSSSVKHGVTLSVTNETFAYLPALNRLMQLIRAEHDKGR